VNDFEESGKREAEVISKLVDRDAVVLDLGCGVGRVAKYLAPFVRELHGVDVSENMVRYAKENCRELGNVHIKVNNGKDLSLYSDGTFDFVYSFLVFQHLEKEDALTYITEVYRVLKNGGRALLQFPNQFFCVLDMPHIQSD
jgi:ubiquinone/menaquinone biosynthesis C-methylase UbiE